MNCSTVHIWWLYCWPFLGEADRPSPSWTVDFSFTISMFCEVVFALLALTHALEFTSQLWCECTDTWCTCMHALHLLYLYSALFWIMHFEHSLHHFCASQCDELRWIFYFTGICASKRCALLHSPAHVLVSQWWGHCQTNANEGVQRIQKSCGKMRNAAEQ